MSERERNLTRVVVRGAGLATAGQILTQAVSLGQYLALARLASPRDFGELAAGSVVVGVGALVSESGMAAAIVQRRDRVEEAASTAVVSTVAGGVLLTLLALAASPVVGFFFHSRRIGLVAAAMSAWILMRMVAIVPGALLQRRFSFLRRVVLDPLGVIAGAAAGIAATASGLGVWGLVIGVYAGVVTQAVLSWAFVGWRPSFDLVSFSMWRELARFGRHVIVSEGIRRLNAEGRTAVVGRGLGSALLGQYALAYRLGVQPISILVNGVSYVLLPALARIANEPARFREAAVRSLRSLFLVAVPVSLVLVPLGRPATVLLFGDRWAPAGTAVAWMAGIGIGTAADSIASETWKAAGRPDWLPRLHGLALVVSLAASAAFLPWGLAGVAAALSLSTVAGGIVGLYGFGRVVGVPLLRVAGATAHPLLAGGAMVAALFALRHAADPSAYRIAPGLLVLAAEALAGGLLYTAVLAVLRPSDLSRAIRLVRGALARERQPVVDAAEAPAPLP
jgi:O-antigen/teichoic acid export membrane protein